MKHRLPSIFSLLFILLCTFSVTHLCNTAVAQTINTYQRIPNAYISGRVTEVRHSQTLGRLPERLQAAVREPVWHLGRNSAGNYVDFQTESDTIYVRYKVSGAHSMPHMPAIGVSGVDLYYRHEPEGDWSWAFGSYSFKDTIQYRFTNVGKANTGIYRLYLPLYNTLEWIEIAGNGTHKMNFISQGEAKPIVVYGTSITQGACATRPGLAWTNIVGRALPNPIVNLGFSGNGRLEEPILELMKQEEAAVFILDCIPNLSLTAELSSTQLAERITLAVKSIRQKHPHVPIVLAAHSSAHTPGFMNVHTQREYAESSSVAEATYHKLTQEEGLKNLHWVSERDFDLDIESTVDYAHPNDIGMMKIAHAYLALLNKLL